MSFMKLLPLLFTILLPGCGGPDKETIIFQAEVAGYMHSDNDIAGYNRWMRELPVVRELAFKLRCEQTSPGLCEVKDPDWFEY